MSAYEYDFGSSMPLPHPQIKREPDEDMVDANFNGVHDESAFRSFVMCADVELLDYLRARNVSPNFLNEIDMFLAANPEIAHHVPEFAEEINYGAPLESYLRFINGYTRPARYAEGVLPSFYDIPDVLPVRLSHKLDPELDTLFPGRRYPLDILKEIDDEIDHWVHELHSGGQVTYEQRKLVVLAVYGNLVDAFKYYEYNYQMERLPHRYVPEHILLDEIPKPAGGEVPNPRQIAYPGDDNEELRSHLDTRLHMARAHDAGVNAIDVLLDDFTAVLRRQGLRRHQIEHMKREAVSDIEHEYEIQGRRDVVDMIMDRTLTAETVPPPPASTKNTKIHVDRVHRTHALRDSLHRLYAQEDRLRYNVGYVLDTVVSTRQLVEREFVAEIIGLATNEGLMDQGDRQYWQKMFTEDAQKERENDRVQIDIPQAFEKYL